MDAIHILLVDDEVELTLPLSRVLQREGYQVDVAMDGDQALAAIESQRQADTAYQLIILDWMLPQRTGLQVCQAMRQQEDPTPVLFLTAKDTLDDRVAGLDVGADDYLIKPFELRELLARVRALIRRNDQFTRMGTDRPEASTHRAGLIRSEGLELDRENLVAYRGTRSISLSEKEAQLLEFLMTHPQQILTHEEIYRHVWPQEDPPSSNVLAAQIRLLRRKIDLPNAGPLITTIYGKGYRYGLA
jgi:two-component system, OmpR family, manganese sensing response regulator